VPAARPQRRERVADRHRRRAPAPPAADGPAVADVERGDDPVGSVRRDERRPEPGILQERGAQDYAAGDAERGGDVRGGT